MKDLHSAFGNERQLRREYFSEMVNSQKEKRDFVPPMLKVDSESRRQLNAAQEKRQRKAEKCRAQMAGKSERAQLEARAAAVGLVLP